MAVGKGWNGGEEYFGEPTHKGSGIYDTNCQGRRAGPRHFSENSPRPARILDQNRRGSVYPQLLSDSVSTQQLFHNNSGSLSRRVGRLSVSQLLSNSVSTQQLDGVSIGRFL